MLKDIYIYTEYIGTYGSQRASSPSNGWQNLIGPATNFSSNQLSNQTKSSQEKTKIIYKIVNAFTNWFLVFGFWLRVSGFRLLSALSSNDVWNNSSPKVGFN